MTTPGGTTETGRPRRRSSWSLKSIVEEVAGRPIDDFQEPGRTPSPYVQHLSARRERRAAQGPRPTADDDPPGAGTVAPDGPEARPLDPVERIVPPLVGPTGRFYHEADELHHRPTLRAMNPSGRTNPILRPERLYLHYLLLHLDRLPTAGLRYLSHAVAEELAHRAEERRAPARASRPAHGDAESAAGAQRAPVDDRVDLHSDGPATETGGRPEGRAGAAERVEDRVAPDAEHPE